MKPDKRTIVLRGIFALLLLVCGAARSWAENYVFVYDTYYAAYPGSSSNSTLLATTTFTPNTCIWVGTSGGSFQNYGNAGAYLYLANGSAQARTSTRNLTIGSNRIYYRQSTWTSYYLRYNNGWTASNSTTNAATVYTVSITDVNPSITNPAISGSPIILSAVGATANCSVIASSAYTQKHTTYTFNNTTYWSTDNGTSATKGEKPSSTTDGITYTWSLSSELAPYATIQDGVVTVTSLPVGVDAVGTVICKASKTVDGVTTVSEEVIVPLTIEYAKVDPTSLAVSPTSKTFYVGETFDITATLTPASCYRNITYSSSAESVASVSNTGTVLGVSLGNATITVTAHKYNSAEVLERTISVTVKDKCATPTISGTGLSYTFSCSHPTSGVTFRYTIDGAAPTSTTGTVGSSVTLSGYNKTIRVIALADGYDPSDVAELFVSEAPQGAGTAADPYLITNAMQLNKFSEWVSSGGSYASAYYKVTASITAYGYTTPTTAFTGTFDGGLFTISGLGSALVGTANGATIKNVILDNVSISGSGNIGAIANAASGAARIYNCGVLATTGSTISGSDDVGGIVGQVTGNTRIINCFSYANITGGTYRGGIVGRNEATATTQSNVGSQAMIMNCMFYGDISTGGTIAPIFGGNNISNAGTTGLNTFNYFRYESPYSVNGNINTYNCALAAEERYLTRFEFYRLQLNSNKELAAWYATGSVDNAAQMAKWVLDKSIAPYPILKPQGIYPSVINFDAESATTQTERNKGGLLGTLSVSISLGTNAPSGASVTKSSLTLNITDKDTANYNYNYRKVQLPYYNEVGIGNYTGNKVVTGWKVSVTGGTNSFSTGTDAPAYNFADPKCTGKDNYETSGRVFAQGAYFNVPDGVTSISIQPYWGNAVYLSDPNYDLVYNTSYSATNVTTMGTRYTNGSSYTINGSSQKVYTSLSNAFGALSTGTSVYDNAIVLVGNYHQYCGSTSAFNNSTKAVTVMSADLDMDNEPDYSFIYQHTDRLATTAVRFDFLNWPGIGMVQKVTGTTRMPNQGIFAIQNWFEVTNTCVTRFTEFEYDDGKSNNAPLILLGGIYEQITSAHDQTPTKTTYIHLGDNAWFKEFQNGTHADGSQATAHNPISVTGGEFENFYLTGTFMPSATAKTDNAECYINGGKFGELAGAGQEKINGNVTFLIDNADIDEFYGGGINENNPISGSISTTINNSYVTKFCGGPKFGDMASGKTVTTFATGTTFGTYYGAGNGGTSYYRDRKVNEYGAQDYSWSTYATSNFTRGSYNSSYGVQANYEYEYFAWAGGNSTNNVARFYTNYATLSFAQTNDVTSTLTGCTVLNDFYGGGNLGKVSGNATSVLTDCTVKGSAFAAGYSASIPTVKVFNESAFNTEPSYNGNVGIYNQGVYPDYTLYTWSNTGSTSNTLTTTDGNNYIYTSKTLTGLGSVSGQAKITLNGGTVEGSVFGGGNESETNGATTVTINDNARIVGNVFGGGNLADVSGATAVNINGGTVTTAVYGGGALANTGNTTVNLNGGTVNDVYGGGLGRQASDSETAVAATVGTTTVNIGSGTPDVSTGLVSNLEGACKITGSVFGCNNLNGTPTGDATVNVFKTVAKGTESDANPYHVLAVYGGGNKAAFDPEPRLGESTTKSTHVNIYTCDNSIQYVYGGGNAASTPATNVVIWGGTFDWVFGGGNGKTEEGQPYNMGANVGYYQDTDKDDVKSHGAAYGTGVANTEVNNGIINHLFGGSNTRGNIRKAAVSQLERGDCDFEIGEVFAAGNEAYMDGEAILNMGCIPGLEVLYGGARKADITNDVQLTITSGTYGQVFGGNKESGKIYGTITVNIEETGCNPIVIGEVYGGGNQAAYEGTVTVNAYSFTQIGKLFGGGYGQGATVTGNTYVNIQQLKGTPNGVESGSLGVVGEVYGGGNAADVIGNTNINIGTASNVTFDSDGTAQTVLGARIEAVDVVIPASITGSTDVTYHGSGNVYGGGNSAIVTGSTNITVGQ